MGRLRCSLFHLRYIPRLPRLTLLPFTFPFDLRLVTLRLRLYSIVHTVGLDPVDSCDLICWLYSCCRLDVGCSPVALRLGLLRLLLLWIPTVVVDCCCTSCRLQPLIWLRFVNVVVASDHVPAVVTSTRTLHVPDFTVLI